MLPTSSMPSGGGPDGSTPANPILTAYDDFVERTPLVTRYILSTQVVSYLISWFVNLEYALANIPQFTLYNFELYRILLSLLVNNNFFSLFISFLSFLDHGRRLEHSMGSTAFGWLCLMVGTLSNVGFLLLSMILSAVRQDEACMYDRSAVGIWLILFGIIGIECVQAPRNTKRRLFVFDVPVLYYPVLLWFFFALLSGYMFSPAHFLSIAVGYGFGFGYLDKFKLTSAKAKEWEDSILLNFTQRQGWVTGHSASGMDAWNDNTSGGSNNNSTGISVGSIFRSPMQQQEQQQQVRPSAGTLASSDAGGRTLGGATRRAYADARAARLQALEGGGNEKLQQQEP